MNKNELRFDFIQEPTNVPMQRGRHAGAGEMDFGRAIALVRRRLSTVVACIAGGAALAIAVSLVLPPTYTAKALLAAGVSDASGAGRSDDGAIDAQIAMLQSSDFLDNVFAYLQSDPNLSKYAAQRTDLDKRLKIMQEAHSRIIGVTFSASTADAAAEIANRIAKLYVEDRRLQSLQSVDDTSEALSAQLRTLEDALARLPPSAGTASPGGSDADRLRTQIEGLKLRQALADHRENAQREALAVSPPIELVALAKPPVRPSSIRSIYIIFPAMVAATIFGIALAVALGGFDDRLYLPSDLAERTPARCVGALPRLRNGWLDRWRRSPWEQLGCRRALDVIAANVILSLTARRRTILVTSANVDPNAAEFAKRLAVSISRAGHSVGVAELSMTRTLAGRGRGRTSEKRADVVDVLEGLAPLADATEPLAPNVDLLPPRPEGVDDPPALIASGRLETLLESLEAAYDVVILIGPPAIGFAETRTIVARSDVTVLVVQSGVSRTADVVEALEVLAAAAPAGSRGRGPNLVTALMDVPPSALPPPLRDRSPIRRPAPLAPLGDPLPTVASTAVSANVLGPIAKQEAAVVGKELLRPRS